MADVTLQNLLPGQVNINEDMKQGINNAVNLATMQEQVEGQKVQLEKQKFDVQKMKTEHGISLLQTFGKMDPKFRGIALDTLKDQARKAGTPMDALFDAMAKDQTFTQQVSSLMNDPRVTERMRKDPFYAVSVLSSANPLDWASSMENAQKAVAQTTQGEYGLEQERIKGQTQRDVAAMSMGLKTDKATQGLITSLTKSPQIKAAVDGLAQLKIDQQTIHFGKSIDPKTGKMRGFLPQQFHELGMGAAAAISGMKGKVSEGSAEAQTLSNLETKINSLLNKVNPGGLERVTGPIVEDLAEQFDNLEKFRQGQLDSALKAARRTDFKSPAMQQAQDEAIDRIRAEYLPQPKEAATKQAANPLIEKFKALAPADQAVALEKLKTVNPVLYNALSGQAAK